MAQAILAKAGNTSGSEKSVLSFQLKSAFSTLIVHSVTCTIAFRIILFYIYLCPEAI